MLGRGTNARNAISGFKASGIYPLKEEAIPDCAFNSTSTVPTNVNYENQQDDVSAHSNVINETGITDIINICCPTCHEGAILT